MATILKTCLIPFLVALALALALAPARSQTVQFYYDFNGPQPNNLIYQGDAHFPTDTTYLRLTQTNASGYPLKYSTGRVLSPTQVPFWGPGTQVDLETTVAFKITTVNNDPADGLTFFIVPVDYDFSPDLAGGSFGIFKSGNNPSVFAVEFDTYVNSDVDPNYRHVGIDIENLSSVNTTRVDDAILDQVVTARINYEEATKLIHVKVITNSKTYEVSYVYDLSSVLNQQVQVGLSASSGFQVAIHDVVSWYFTATVVHTGSDIKIQQYV